MRGSDIRTGDLFSYVDLEQRVPANHPLRLIRRIVNEVLAALHSEFGRLYATEGRPSIAPERLLRALLLQAFYSIRSERQLMEQLHYNLLYRWFIGLGVDDQVWVPTVFTKNRDRLLEAEVARKFLAELLAHRDVRALLSDDHFSVDGTQVQAWASMKSFVANDGSSEPQSPGRNGERHFHREQRSNQTHGSITDPVGSAARHHKLYAPWLLPENCRAGMVGLRGAIAPSVGLMAAAVREIKDLLHDAGVADQPVGVDLVEPPFLFEMQRQGLTVVDAQQLMLDARVIKSSDEIMLSTSRRHGRRRLPGHRRSAQARHAGERDRRAGQQAPVRDGLGRRRVGQRGLRRAVQPAPAQLLRPHDPAGRPGFFDIIHSYNGYRTCYYRTFGVGRSTPSAARRLHQGPGVDRRRDRDGQARASAPTRSPRCCRRREDFGFDNEMAAFGLQFGHGLGLGLHERPIISRLNSHEGPVEMRRAWSSRWRPTARRATASRPPGSRRRSW